MQRAFDTASGPMDDVSMGGPADDPSASSPVEIPEEIFERASTLCLALPEVTVRVDLSLSRPRSAAHSFEIRRRSFCLLVARRGRPGPASR